MAALTGQSISSTYDSLLKVTDNGPITSSNKTITDGLGNSTSLQLSSVSAIFTGTVVTQSSLDVSAEIYHRNNIAVLNKVGDSWVHWASRDTSGAESVINLSNIGNITLGGTLNKGAYTYTLPSATGTLALTSDLSSYVTLSTTQTISGTKTFTDDVNIIGTDGVPSLTVTASGSVSRAISASTSGSSSIAIIADGTSGASGVVASAGNGAYGVQGNNTGSGWGGGFTSVSGPAIAAVSTSGVGGTFQSGSANIAEFYGSGATLNATVAQSGLISSTPQGTLYGTASGSITSAQLATSLSDETGTGNVVFSASPTFTGDIAISGNGNNNHNLIFNQISSSNNVFQGVDFKDGNGLIRSAIRQEQTNYATGLTDLVFYNGATSLPERMRLFSSGNFAVGTSADSGYKLDVNGTGRFNGNLTISSGNVISLLQANNGNGSNIKSVTNGDFVVTTGGTPNALIIANNGAATFSSLGTGTVYSNGGTLTNTNPSDLNLKTNIEDITYGLNEVLQLKPKSYLWKEDKINQGKQFGFIAQDVQEVMPELVKQGEYLGLDKEAIFVILVKAIQELKAEIDILKNK